MPVLDGFAEATMIWKATTAPQQMTVSVGILDADPGGPRTAAAVADLMYTVFTTGGHPGAANAMIDDYQFLGVSVAVGSPTGDIVGQHLATINGSVTDSCVPSNCALLVAKNTALGGRRFRGRFFAPPSFLNEGAVDQSGNIVAANVTALQTQWDAVRSGMVAVQLEPMLFHQGASAPAPTPITSFTVQSQIATQRRRMRR